MINLECLKTVDRTIAVGNRRDMVTFDKSNVPIIYSGILREIICVGAQKEVGIVLLRSIIPKI